jgi:hypothetical protein
LTLLTAFDFAGGDLLDFPGDFRSGPPAMTSLRKQSANLFTSSEAPVVPDKFVACAFRISRWRIEDALKHVQISLRPAMQGSCVRPQVTG